MVALVGLGIALRLVQYAAAESLWIDEAMVSLSIVGRSPGELIFSPLEYSQVAPPLFLLAAKGATELLGPTEFALRLPALVCSIGALVLFAVLARRVLEGAAVPLAVGLFSVSPMLVAYAAEVKQYSGDLLAAVLLSLLALELRASSFSRRRVVTAALAGLVIVWLSQGAVFVLAGLALALASLAFLERDGRAFSAIVPLAVVWSVAAAAAVLAARHNIGPGSYNFLHTYWNDGFMPSSLDPRATAAWLYGSARSFYPPGLGVRTLGGACVALEAVGTWVLWRKGRRDVVLVLAAPVLVALAASALRLYPISGRLSLFLVPAFVAFLAAGVGWLAGLWRDRAPAVQIAILLLFAAPPAYGVVRRHPPWWREDIKTVLEHVADNRRAGDAVYVFWWAQPAMAFYGPRYGFTPGDWTKGGHFRSDPRSYLRDVERFRGHRRLWVIFSRNIPGAQDAIKGYLGLIGTRRDSIAGRHTRLKPDAVAYLFDLSDSVRLKSSSADSYPLR